MNELGRLTMTDMGKPICSHSTTMGAITSTAACAWPLHLNRILLALFALYTFVTVGPDPLPVVFVVVVKPRENDPLPHAVNVTAERVRVHLWQVHVLVRGHQGFQAPWSDLTENHTLKTNIMDTHYHQLGSNYLLNKYYNFNLYRVKSQIIMQLQTLPTS